MGVMWRQYERSYRQIMFKFESVISRITCVSIDIYGSLFVYKYTTLGKFFMTKVFLVLLRFNN